MIVLKAGSRKWWVEQVVFSPDGSLVAAPCGMFGVYLLPAFGTTGVVEPLPLPVDHAGRAVFTPDGKLLYCGRRRLCVVNVTDRVAVPFSHIPWAEARIGVSPDGARLIVAETHGARSRYMCYPATGRADQLWRVEFDGTIESGPLFPPDGERFFASEETDLGYGRTRTIRTRSLTTGEEVPSISSWAGASIISMDGHWTAGVFGIWAHVAPAPGNTRPGASFKNDSRRQFTDIAFHPSGQYLATTSNDNTVKLYRIESREVVKTYTWDVGRMRSIAFTRDGLRAAVGSDTGQIVIWDVDV